jgi:hypothetical protein
VMFTTVNLASVGRDEVNMRALSKSQSEFRLTT